jgi:UTP--glucose-1-phosphate uridylyltransferase
MLPVVDKPAIQYVVEEAVAAGVRDILIVTGRGKRAIEDHFDVQKDLEDLLRSRGLTEELWVVKALGSLARILYVRQGEPLGLGHAVLAAERYVGEEEFAVMLGDDLCISGDPCIGTLRGLAQRVGASVIAVSEVAADKVPKYGMVIGQEVEPGLLKVESIVEKPSLAEVRSNLVTIGRYCLRPAIWPLLHRVKPDTHGEVQLTDGLRGLIDEDGLYAWVFPGSRFDVGDKADWIRATIRLAMERPDLRDQVRRILVDSFDGDAMAGG